GYSQGGERWPRENLKPGVSTNAAPQPHRKSRRKQSKTGSRQESQPSWGCPHADSQRNEKHDPEAMLARWLHLYHAPHGATITPLPQPKRRNSRSRSSPFAQALRSWQRRSMAGRLGSLSGFRHTWLLTFPRKALREPAVAHERGRSRHIRVFS